METNELNTGISQPTQSTTSSNPPAEVLPNNTIASESNSPKEKSWLKKLGISCGILSIIFVVLGVIATYGFWNENFGTAKRNDKYIVSKLSKEYPSLNFRIDGTDTLQEGPALFQNHDVLKYRTYYREPKSGIEGFLYAEKHMVESMNKPNYAYSDLIYPKRTDPIMTEQSFLSLIKQLASDKSRSEYFYRTYWLNYRYSAGFNYTESKWSRNSGLKFGSYNGDNLVIAETIVLEKLSGTTWDFATFGKINYYLYNKITENDVELLIGDFDYNKLKSDMNNYKDLRKSLENKDGYNGFNLDSWLANNKK